jgi:two-component system chemotaxis sensor kinase CheA
MLGLSDNGTTITVEKAPALVLAAGDRQAAFLVDEFLAEQEVVVKGLGHRVRRLSHVVAATVLPSGRVTLVLNAARLVETALTRADVRMTGPAAASVVPAKKRVLVAEDSLTTRTLQKTILETAGYEVLTAPDGTAAWQLLQAERVDVVVSDVDMPGMDGFALTRAVRGAAAMADLPVVLVTSRGTEDDRARGVEAGADAYLVKSGFDQAALLGAITRLIG